MRAGEILTQALQHIPALVFLWALIYASYWLVGVVKLPRWRGRDAVLDHLGGVDPEALGEARLGTLALVSFVSLFMELLLIRWVASDIRIFAYFKSLVLIACYLGFGLGCYLTRKRIRVAYTIVPLIVLVAIVELPWVQLRHLVINLSGFIGWFSDVHIFSRAYFSGNPMWGIISALMAISIVIPLFGLIAVSFVPLGQLVGWYLERSTKGVTAYSVNVLASMAGIWLFTLLSFMATTPLLWFALLGAGLLACFWRSPAARRTLLEAFGVIVLLFVAGEIKPHWWGEESWKGATAGETALQPGAPEILWSPYQKLTLVPLLQDGKVKRYVLNTNDSWYQQILDLRDPETQREEEARFRGPIRFEQYNLPYAFLGRPPQRVLIAGGGMGNDAAAALRNGAASVDVAEIDPLIVSRGRDLHFEHPYRDPRVHTYIDDARAFIENARGTYDLIVFSILDSHTTTSNYTNIRLDNYVYTLEALQATKKLLAPNGVFVMSFSSERPWFGQRLKDVTTSAFGREPLVVRPDMYYIVVGNGDAVQRSLARDPELRSFVNERNRMPMAPAAALTDDWPYLYQQNRGIPVIIWVMSLGLVAISALAFRGLKTTRGGLDWHFFFLGAAFMLLEVQVISKVALLFGTTWLVNSIVISALLAFILLSNAVAARFPRLPRPLAYVGLFTMLAVSYLVPAHAIFFDSVAARTLAATGLYCSPVFFAGLIFITSFRDIGFRAEAFGSNLLGSLVGGLLDSLSFAIGLNALVLVAAVLYLLAMLTRQRAAVAAVEAQPGTRAPTPELAGAGVD